MLSNQTREYLFKLKKLQQTLDVKSRVVNLQRLLALWSLEIVVAAC